MTDNPQRGLFFPGEQAVAAAAPGAVAAPRPAAPPDPTAEAAAAAVRAQAKKGGISRRLLVRWVGWGSIMAVVAGGGNGFLSFFYPHKTGACGGTLTAGTVDELKPGEVKVVSEGKFYLSRV